MRKKRLNGEGTISKVKRGDKDYYRYMVTTGYDDLGRQLRKQFYGKTQEEAINRKNHTLLIVLIYLLLL